MTETFEERLARHSPGAEHIPPKGAQNGHDLNPPAWADAVAPPGDEDAAAGIDRDDPSPPPWPEDGWPSPDDDGDAPGVDSHAHTNGQAHTDGEKRAERDREKTEKPSRPSELPPLLDAADFMATFTPPDYLVDGIIQRGRLHSLTSPTGHGKTAVALYVGCMVALGRNIGNIEVTQGEVIILAGENPDDLCGRLHASCQFLGIDPCSLLIRVMPGNYPLTPDKAEVLKQQIDNSGRPPALIIADTAAAFFDGDDDNHNVQMGAFARNLRVLTQCKGNPAIVVPCHPTKNASADQLLPRGGGAFLNEMDVNLTLWSQVQGETAVMHWQGKIRGADFQPVGFALQQVRMADVVDKKGRPFISIVATLQTAADAENVSRAARSDEDTVLEWLRRCPGISLRDIAVNAGWMVTPANGIGEPAANKSKVQRLLDALAKDKLAVKHRGKWKITEAGKTELERGHDPNRE